MDDFEEDFLNKRLVDTGSVDSSKSFKSRNRVFIEVDGDKPTEQKGRAKNKQSRESSMGEHCELAPSYLESSKKESIEQKINPVFQNDKSGETANQEDRKTKSMKKMSMQEVRSETNRRRRRGSRGGPRSGFWRRKNWSSSRRRERRRRSRRTRTT